MTNEDDTADVAVPVDVIAATLAIARIRQTYSAPPAQLQGADLKGLPLDRANLTDANLTRARLPDANLSRANLTDAKLTRANLTRARLHGANQTARTCTART